MKFSKPVVIGICVLIVAIVGVIILSQNNSNGSNTSNSSSSSQSSANCNSVSSSAVTKSDGLVIDDKLVCSGSGVKSGDTITIHYTGKLTDGTVFDSSVTKNTPFKTKIGVGQVIKGWDEGLIGMTVGSKRTLTIPAELGYGPRAVGSIPANSTLIFDLELLAIK